MRYYLCSIFTFVHSKERFISRKLFILKNAGLVLAFLCIFCGCMAFGTFLPEAERFSLANEDIPDELVPVELKQPELSMEGITLAWQGIDDVSSYQVWRAVDGGEEELVATVSPSQTDYLDANPGSGSKFTYRVFPLESLQHTWSEAKTVLGFTIKISKLKKDGIKISWADSIPKDAAKVELYRKLPWTGYELLTTETPESTGYYDADLVSGAKHTYYVRVTGTNKKKLKSVAVAVTPKLFVPKITKAAVNSNGKLKVVWTTTVKAAGYEVQYSNDASFTNPKSKQLNSTTSSVSVGSMSTSKTVYVRVRSWVGAGEHRSYSMWRYSTSASADRTGTMTKVKRTITVKVKQKTKSKKSKTKTKKVKKTVALNLRTLIKQSTGGFDTVQGSCSDGTYAYYMMYNQSKERCRIAKVRISSSKLVKVSGTLKVYHGNDITYDSKRKQLLVANCTVLPMRISYVNPKTLNVTKTKTVKVPSKLQGATSSALKAIEGISSIAYNASHDQFVLLLKERRNFLITNSSLTPVRYVTMSKKISQLHQGIESKGDMIYVAQAPKSFSRNGILVYDWDGTYLRNVNLSNGQYEIESIYFVKNKLYASFYYPHGGVRDGLVFRVKNAW